MNIQFIIKCNLTRFIKVTSELLRISSSSHNYGIETNELCIIEPPALLYIKIKLYLNI